MASAHTIPAIDEVEDAQTAAAVSVSDALDDAPHSEFDGTASMSRTGILPKVDDSLLLDDSVDEAVLDEEDVAAVDDDDEVEAVEL